MDGSFTSQDPAILQLRKWGPTQFQLKLSEFREAFISPSKELLLLLSYQCEALLLPLITGTSIDGGDISDFCSDENLQSPCLSASFLQDPISSSRSDSKDYISCPSGSVTDVDNGFSIDHSFSRSNDNPSICDVNSLAWGACGDTYDQHKDISFRELLFVSGNHGVTVHAFCCSDGNSKTTRYKPEGEFREGRWVEWGPSISCPNVGAEKPIDLCYGALVNEKSVSRNGKGMQKIHEAAGIDMSSGVDVSKRWLRSFFTKAVTIESEGNIFTRFPEKSSIPCSAKVISFSIFDSDLPVIDFLSRGKAVLNDESTNETVLVLDSDPHTNGIFSSSGQNSNVDVLSKNLGACVNSLYKCTKVFSSNSHCLVGFFLKLDFSSAITSHGHEISRSKNILVVAQLYGWGMQWLSIVKLEERTDAGPEAEWVDFQFSDNLLVCLTSSGSIFFYAAISGEYITHLDILQTCGPSLSLLDREKMSLGADKQGEQGGEAYYESKCCSAGYFCGRTFRRLIVASYTSLLAAVDKNGIVYVIYAGDHVPNEYYASDKFLPLFKHSGLGMLVGWEIGGLDIGHQRAYSDLPGSHHLDNLTEGNVNNSISDNTGSNIVHKLQDFNLNGSVGLCNSWLNGFSAQSQITEQRFNDLERKLHSHLIRKVFLPIDGYKEDDCICFSSFGVTRLTRKKAINNKLSAQIVHFDLQISPLVNDSRCLNSVCDIFSVQGRKEALVGEAVGCSFQGCLYLVTQCGISVCLPTVSVSSISSNFSDVETIGYRQPRIKLRTVYQDRGNLEIKEPKQPWLASFSPWNVEIMDKVLLFEGPEEADRVCLDNGWDLKIPRMRRLQMALDYLKFDEINESLEKLVGVHLAEEGILRVLFATVYLLLNKRGNDNEVSAASRLLTLATCFATKMIRKYGLLEHKNDAYILEGLHARQMLFLPPVLPDKAQNETGNSRRLHEMAHFLEIMRKLQYRISAIFRKPGQVDGEKALSMMDPDLLQDESQLSIVSVDAVSLETTKGHELSVSESGLAPYDTGKLSLMTKDSFNSKAYWNSEDSSEVSDLVPEGLVLGKNVPPLENPKEMIARWKVDKLDLKTVVKDALLSGRLPLAVLQLHLHHSKEILADEEPHDIFTEVRDIGRAIAYDLFLKGETGLAVATLQKLGEDIEICLKQLLFGTVRRSLRVEIAEEVRRYGYLGPYEWKILETLTLIERLYPSSYFWRTYLGRVRKPIQIKSTLNSLGEVTLHLLDMHMSKNLIIKCGEIDGIVVGSWINISDNLSEPVADEDAVSAGYWAAAAVWSNAWDQRTVDRIVLDQPLLMGVHVPWESQVEYHICHNEWDEVSKLLDLVPNSVLSDGNLQIALDSSQPTSTVGSNGGFADCGDYIYSVEELDAVCMDVPDIKLFRLSASAMCSIWLRMLMEQELAKKLIFLKEYWEGTAEIIHLLARAGFITGRYKVLIDDDATESPLDLKFSDERFHVDTVHALHKLFVKHCAQYNLPNLLDLYLDHHKLLLDNASVSSLLEAAGDCHWARWLLLSRIKGREYDASFSNARSIMSRNLVRGTNLTVLEIDEIISTVDDIAEGGGEMAALATLMYAPAPIQQCLSRGSINRHSSSSAQCTLENLRPILQRFPMLWRTLVAACFGQDTTSNFCPKANYALSDYLNWRDSIFFSAERDTSLLQMLPCWFPKAVRRLIQLYVQGPLAWQSFSGLPTGESLLHRDIDFFMNADEHTVISAISWEAIIQKHIEEELYDSSVEETGFGLEHHLHRGRALAAFNHLLGMRVEKFKLEEQSGFTACGQTNVQSDVQTLLAPITQSEKSILSSVMPLAITHFEDSVLVASCAFLLELCGLSASMLRVDVAALRRISSFYKSSENSGISKQVLPRGSALCSVSHESDILGSLARALADEYVRQDAASNSYLKGSPSNVAVRRPCHALMLVLQHLEKASLPQIVDGKTCGNWLLTGNGDGAELRSQQKAVSQHWSLVANFCQMHQLPLSTKYLALLARDNDWVGFLSEAQVGGFPFDVVVQVASKEFSDRRLKIHILTVLRGMQSRRKASLPSQLDATEKRDGNPFSDDHVYIPVELFRILADCEKQKNPGEALLIKAKDLSWSILAMVASCFPDVSPFSCLTVWLEITAARETSSIKVNDIASQIADNVAAAVDASNSLPVESRVVQYHYNRQNPKRRRLRQPVSVDSMASSHSSSTSARIFAAEGVMGEQQRKVEVGEHINVSSDLSDGAASLSKMVAVLCEQRLFVPLLRAFEMFLPSCCLLPFIRALQAFSQMRLSEASAHLGSFSARIRDEPVHLQAHTGRESHVGTSWISSVAVKAADAMLSTCPSPYEKRCLLKLLAATDFGDGGSAAAYYRRLYWKINLAEPSLRKDDDLHLGNETLDDASLLTALEKNRHWEQARNWAKQLEASGAPWKSAVHHVTETQAESMVAEWKEFLWDVPEERIALWGHCQTLFIRNSFPALQAGLFFLKHAEIGDKDLPATELHELLLLSLQWLSGMITHSNPVYPLHLLREIETRVWLLAVESEALVKSEGEFSSTSSNRVNVNGNTVNIIEQTANMITKMDNHINSMKNRVVEKHDARDSSQAYHRNQVLDTGSSTIAGGSMKSKRRAKAYVPPRRPLVDYVDKNTDPDDTTSSLNPKTEHLQDESTKIEMSFSKWEERIGPAERERAVLSLLEFGQITAAKQLQHKLSPGHIPSEFMLVDAALKLAATSTPSGKIQLSMLDEDVRSVIQSYNIQTDQYLLHPMQVVESFATLLIEGSGRGLCNRVIAVLKAANVLGLSFCEAFEKQPVELLQLLSLKAQESFEEACLLVQTHSMPAAGIAQILAESFLKGLLAAHRGGYMDSQKEEGPAPLLWRFSDFLKWAELCPSEPEVGHALMRLVITGQEIPHACEVELLILSHHFYKSSACLDGVDVLVALAATRVEAYVSEGDFPCLARLITGVGNFHALNFILGILIENGQLDLLLQKYSAAADTNTSTAEAVRGFRMAVLTSLKHFNPNDLDAFAMVYNHFDMKHETAALLESRAEQASQQWFQRYDRDQNEDLLDSMRYYIEAAEVHSSIDAGNKTRRACAQASLVSLQIRMPDSKWLNLSDTNARRALVEQSRFQEALIVAEAYGLNQPSEWALVLWNQMLNPELTEAFVAEFVAVLPLQSSMLLELARFYRAEVAARGDQSQFSVWLTGGGLPAEWAKYLGRSFRCLLKRTRDLRLRMQLATVATGFSDVVDSCMKALDKIPDTTGLLVLRKGHGGAYLPLM